jgi:D-alanyl-lipoteichoic acid acyltransferase DltB (MBOAT superfamily)
MLTMLLGGLWHGANWTFIVWGGLHGAALVVHRFYSRWRGQAETPAASPAYVQTVSSWLLTFCWVAFCFTIFRCANIQVAWQFFAGATKASAFHLSGIGWLMLLLLGLAHFIVWRHRATLIARLRRTPDVVFYPALGAACAVLLYLTPLNLAAFIYFQF